MPTPTLAEYQQMIVLEIGDDIAGTISAQIGAIWNISSVGAYSVHHQYLKAKLKAIDILLGKLRLSVNFSSSGDLSVQLRQKFENLQSMRANTLSDLASISPESAGMTSGAEVGDIARTSPVMPTDDPSAFGDASGRRYRGDPYER